MTCLLVFTSTPITPYVNIVLSCMTGIRVRFKWPFHWNHPVNKNLWIQKLSVFISIAYTFYGSYRKTYIVPYQLKVNGKSQVLGFLIRVQGVIAIHTGIQPVLSECPSLCRSLVSHKIRPTRSCKVPLHPADIKNNEPVPRINPTVVKISSTVIYKSRKLP